MTAFHARSVRKPPFLAADARRAKLGVRVLVVMGAVLAGSGAAMRFAGDPSGWHLSIVFLAASVSYLVVGALIVERRPGNLVGPLVLGLGFLLVGYVALDASIRQPIAPPVVAVMALAVSVVDGPFFLLVAVLFLVFPDGRLPSASWRRLVALEAMLGGVVLLGALLRPGAYPYYSWLENPLDPPKTILTDIWEIAYGLMVIGVGAAAVSLVGRWRRAGVVERAQLKWVAAASALVAASMLGYGAGAGPTNYSEAGDLAVGATMSLFPVAIGIAVLRYRLYEIDRLISRTIGWALVTGLLVAIFAALVVSLQTILAPLTDENTLAVAASTLVAFALFQPLRRRVQRVVDRRFDRARYSGDRVSTAFSARLRDIVDLAGVEVDFKTTVQGALSPSTAALWIRARSDIP